MPQREFKLGDILSVTTPFCITTMSGLVSVLEYMTGEERGSDMWTAFFAPKCAESLLQQFPQLADVTTPDTFEDKTHVEHWLAEQEAIYGKTLTVRTLADVADTSR